MIAVVKYDGHLVYNTLPRIITQLYNTRIQGPVKFNFLWRACSQECSLHSHPPLPHQHHQRLQNNMFFHPLMSKNVCPPNICENVCPLLPSECPARPEFLDLSRFLDNFKPTLKMSRKSGHF